VSDFVLSLSCRRCHAGDMFIRLSVATVAEIAATRKWDVAAGGEVESELLLRLFDLDAFGEPICRECADEAGLL
jgi:hypothetical protein